MNNIKQIIVGGVLIDILTRKGWADRMVAHCQSQNAKPFVHFSVNGQVLATNAKDPAYSKMLAAAHGRYADGQSLVIASRYLTSTPLPERTATTDFFHDAAKAASEAKVSFYFLGATPESIEIAVTKIREIYPDLIIAGYRNGYVTEAEEPAVIKAINDSAAQVLWIGMGVPRQEKFIFRNLEDFTSIKWIKTCGGLFDYFQPSVRRAPRWMQKYGLEWLFRAIQDPSKYLRRYLTTNGLAAWLLLTKTHDLKA